MATTNFKLGRIEARIHWKDNGEGADLCLFSEHDPEPVAIINGGGAEVAEELTARLNIALSLQDVRTIIRKAGQAPR